MHAESSATLASSSVIDCFTVTRNYLGLDDEENAWIVPEEMRKVLYSANVSVISKVKGKMKFCYVMRNHGNDVVVPDKLDLDQYRRGVVTWEGFKLNYLAKLMRSEAEEWMKRVSAEAVSADVVLVSDEKDAEHCYRILLAERMLNMFSGQMNMRYVGEIK
jgi:hypothetical protein